MVDPRRNVPIAILGNVIVNGVLRFAYCLLLLFSLGDLNTLLASPTGFPFMQLFENTNKSVAGGTILSLVVSLVAVAANAAGLTSTSRRPCSLLATRQFPSTRNSRTSVNDSRYQSVWSSSSAYSRLCEACSIWEAQPPSTPCFQCPYSECTLPIRSPSSSCWSSGASGFLSAFRAWCSDWAT